MKIILLSALAATVGTALMLAAVPIIGAALMICEEMKRKEKLISRQNDCKYPI